MFADQTISGSRTRLRLDLAYDGTHFAGWAKQPGLRTVQGELERAIALVTRKEQHNVALTVAGRTDAGVHARGQVCHFDVTDDELAKLSGRAGEISAIARKLNGVLKRHDAGDIEIHTAQSVPEEFDARFSALSRRYEYRVRPYGVRRDPLARLFTVDLAHTIDIDLLRRASALFLGLQDFTSYCKAREGATSIRTLLDFSWEVLPDGVLTARIMADAFCHSMVRSLVGAVLAVAAQRMTLEELQRITAGKTRSSKITVMPPHGLSLEEITYPRAEELRQRATQTRARREPFPEDGAT